MGKTILILKDNSGNPISDAVVVTLKSKVSPFTEYSSILEPVSGNSNGARIFNGLPANDYDLKYDGTIQTNLSPLFIAGPEIGIPWSPGAGSVDTTNLADRAITTIKIGTSAVTSNELADNSIVNSKLVDNSVSSIKVANGSITKTKLSSNVFGSGMLSTSTGWQPNLDSSTLDYDPNNKIELKTGAVSTSFLADNAVTAVKVAANAITQSKIADGSIIKSKIGTGAVGIDALEAGAVTSIALGANAVTASKIGTGAVTFDKLDSTATSLINKVPTKVAYVSPAYSDNVSPYFDNITQAVADVQAVAGTVIVEPGIYIENIKLGASVNIIGIDKTKCIINWVPTSLNPAAIDITGIDSEDILIKNLTIKCLSDHNINIPSYGIRLTGANGSFVRGEDLLIKVKSKNDSVSPEESFGIHTSSSDYIFERCQIEVEGGQHLASGTGANAYGVYINTTSLGIFNDIRIRSVGGGGVTDGKGYGYYLASITSVNISVERSTIESLEADLLTVSSSFYSVSSTTNELKIFSCQYNGPATNINTNKVVASTQDTNIEVISQL